MSDQIPAPTRHTVVITIEDVDLSTGCISIHSTSDVPNGEPVPGTAALIAAERILQFLKGSFPDKPRLN